jgi:tRNA/tmRNA/rRNA uracil-C5-methylase (TrmA/RlmC/RlmD family)
VTGDRRRRSPGPVGGRSGRPGRSGRAGRSTSRSVPPRDGPTLVGERYDVELGPIAHGGHVVARLPADLPDVGGSVVFVRHGLPGERVTVEVTEGAPGDRYLRADAVEIHEPSPDRVVPPCPHAGPGLCGGCDFQHVDLVAQRRLKAEVVAEQLQRLAGLERSIVVEPVPGDVDGLGWRTRMRYATTPDGRLGLRAARSHRVVPIDRCLIAAPDALTLVEGEVSPEPVVEEVLGQRFTVARDGFWQSHRGAPGTLVRAVLDLGQPRVGEVVVDLYCGVGLFTAFLADAVGATGRVVGVEGDRTAVEHARGNLADRPWAELHVGAVDRVLEGRLLSRADVVVLDPPREGAKRRVLEQVTALRPRTVVLVACDPAAFARDTALLDAAGYRLDRLRAFDLFPMTQHVEVVASFVPTVGQAAQPGPSGRR